MTEQEFMALTEEARSKPVAMRSCWKCNAAHQWMKTDQDNVYCCIVGCGHYFYKGHDLSELEAKFAGVELEPIELVEPGVYAEEIPLEAPIRDNLRTTATVIPIREEDADLFTSLKHKDEE